MSVAAHAMPARSAADMFAHDAGARVAAGVPEGYDAALLAKAARVRHEAGGAAVAAVHIARDDRRLAALRDGLRFFAPDADVLVFPAWDCVAYDRISPDAEIAGRRIATLAKLSRLKAPKQPTILLTTVAAAVQRVPPRDAMRKAVLKLAAGIEVNYNALVRRLEQWGFRRTGTVMEPGEYAVRGGILDLFPTGQTRPYRLDFFGDTLETVRVFDPLTQRSAGAREVLWLMPASEVPSGDEAVRLFRERYIELFGAAADDPLYASVSAGGHYPGEEHWLPLFYPALETLFDYAPGALLTLDHNAEAVVRDRIEAIADHYEARRSAGEEKSFGAAPYRPVPPRSLFLDDGEWQGRLAQHAVRVLSPYVGAPGGALDMGGKGGRTFAAERSAAPGTLFETVAGHIAALQREQRRVVIAAGSPGARERLMAMLKASGLKGIAPVEDYGAALALKPAQTAFAVFEQDGGYTAPGLAVVAEADILGDRTIRRRKPRKGADVLAEAASLSPGDLVVHIDHGIARFVGLKAIEAMGAPHDCVELEYAGGDRLYLPVENIDLLSRYGSEDAEAALDRLGGAAWQARKARLKTRILEMAGALLRVAAERATRHAPVMPVPEAYDQFVARFPYEETDDQLSSIEAVTEDLARGRPMDRLVCGDVGFGKTEVALRAAYIAAMSGTQVAVVVPTTLLARQHYQRFCERFAGMPLKLGNLSRLVAAKDMATTREGLKTGQIDIVIGTHALLAKSIEFADLGLLIIDEEQHFGVAHKERLKALKADVHVLTLTATPIPRTLQLALTGVREMSVITTPPVDRLAVRTFIAPFDPVTIREALLRERHRGGQSFYVCPRIADLPEIAEFLAAAVPELKVVQAHGQMGAGHLEDVMSAFYDRQFDVLLATTIVESGLDVPNANTLIVHRADMFGLAQLYQLRGRVGRSKTRAYAVMTTPASGRLTEQAEKRLKVLHSLDSLGAGFTLASHDLDLRGGGNLLGEEQSGHIREVGFELYQSMLEETVAALREGGSGQATASGAWSPAISIGGAVLIPEAYVPDLGARLGLYRRLSALDDAAAIADFAAELTDRFGPLPDEVRHLLQVVEIKALCRTANIAQIDAGPKGAVIAFRDGTFPNPAGLLAHIGRNGKRVKVQPDQRLVVRAEGWDLAEDRLAGVTALTQELAALALSGAGQAG